MKKSILIGISGAPSSGKTTTAHLLRHKLSGRGFSREVVREYARHWIEKYGQIDDIYQQWHIYYGQTKWEEQARKNYQFVLSDSPRFLPYLYSLGFLDYTKPASVAAAVALYEIAVNSLKDYSRLYLLMPPECVEQDGIRCQTDADVNAIFEASRQFLRNHCPDLFVEVPSHGKDPEAYANFIIADLQGLGLVPPDNIAPEQLEITPENTIVLEDFSRRIPSIDGFYEDDKTIKKS